MTRTTMALGSLFVAALALAASRNDAVAQGEDGAVAAVLRRAGLAPTQGALAGTDPKARAEALDALERSYPLPRSVLDTENRLPPNPGAVMDQLGLVRRPGAPLTDLSGGTPTSRQITDALAPR